eukprot:TRINITY_DN6411_c0_g1_i2.p1 TRINITY_DN6411_c0_g1~~TRINITY_DN6411_c0_g1_i2.p1  ORF type:complete len:131 (+),score=30.35 TRINITY_DN6411_c0_g1_i2:87-479(+)
MLKTQHPIDAWRVLGHSDVEPARQPDPGPKFNWQLLSKAGIGHTLQVESGKFDANTPTLKTGDKGDAVRALQADLQLFGYPLRPWGEYDAVTTAIVSAFQMHHRQRVTDGMADAETVAVLKALLHMRRDQ